MNDVSRYVISIEWLPCNIHGDFISGANGNITRTNCPLCARDIERQRQERIERAYRRDMARQAQTEAVR